MNQSHGDGPFSHRGRNALQVAAPDVTDREHAGQSRLEQVGHPGKRPVRGGQILLGQVRSRLDEALSVQRDAPLEPSGVRNGPRHDENMPEFVVFHLTRARVSPRYALQMTITL